jgi:hypothetical protein
MMTDSIDQATETMVRNLEVKTGKTLAQWVSLGRKAGSKHGEIVKALKDEHGLTHGYANLVALRTVQQSLAPAARDLLAAQYAGDKAALRPIYDKLAEAVAKFGGVELAPKRAYVSLRRSKQFACIQPSTAARVDVGINLKGAPPAGRLELSGNFNAMFTHRVRLSDATEVDQELITWLRQAYDQA